MMANRVARFSFALCLTFAFLRSAQAAECNPGNLLRAAPWIRFEVAAGRVCVPNLAAAPNRNLTAENRDSKESLTLNSAGDDPSLSYRYEDPGRELSVEYKGSRVFVLRDAVDGVTVLFEQSPGKNLRLRVESGEFPARESLATSLWHLLVFSPDAKTFLLPRLDLVSSAWRLEREAAEVEDHLLVAIESNWQKDRLFWQSCVRELGSSDYYVRQEADRQLRAGGKSAVAFLQTVPRAQLEPEQSRRIHHIVDSASHRRDEPATVAAGLVYDRYVWCKLLRDENPQRRRTAARHLSRLLERPLRFDPDADAKTRDSQIRAIEDTLLDP